MERTVHKSDSELEGHAVALVLKIKEKKLKMLLVALEGGRCRSHVKISVKTKSIKKNIYLKNNNFFNIRLVLKNLFIYSHTLNKHT